MLRVAPSLVDWPALVIFDNSVQNTKTRRLITRVSVRLRARAETVRRHARRKYVIFLHPNDFSLRNNPPASRRNDAHADVLLAEVQAHLHNAPKVFAVATD